MQRDVGAERQWLLKVGGREGVVDDHECAGGVRGLGRGGDVDDVQRRVRRCLEPDEPRSLLQVLDEAGRDLLRERKVKR